MSKRTFSAETIKWSPSPATWARTTERGAISSEFPWQGKTDSSVGGGQASEIYHLLDMKLNNSDIFHILDMKLNNSEMHHILDMK